MEFVRPGFCLCMAHLPQAPAATAPNAAMPMMPGMANLQHLGKLRNVCLPFWVGEDLREKKGRKEEFAKRNG